MKLVNEIIKDKIYYSENLYAMDNYNFNSQIDDDLDYNVLFSDTQSILDDILIIPKQKIESELKREFKKNDISKRENTKRS